MSLPVVQYPPCFNLLDPTVTKGYDRIHLEDQQNQKRKLDDSELGLPPAKLRSGCLSASSNEGNNCKSDTTPLAVHSPLIESAGDASSDGDQEACTARDLQRTKPTPEERTQMVAVLVQTLTGFVAKGTITDQTQRVKTLAERLEARANDLCTSTQNYQTIIGQRIRQLHLLRVQKRQELQALSKATPVCNGIFWEWQHPRGHWVRYLHSDSIERLYAKQCCVLRYALGEKVYELNLQVMKQTNLKSGTSRSIRRFLTHPSRPAVAPDHSDLWAELPKHQAQLHGCESGTFFPQYWNRAPSLDPVAMVLVEKSSEEFAKVAKLFYDGAPPNDDRKIESIERVEAPLLWRNYAGKAVSIACLNGGNAREMFLFHGTTKGAINPICHQGFNRSFCGIHGAALGVGVYFALNSAYSTQPTFSPADEIGCSKVILSRVAVGQYTKGNASLRTPPVNPEALGKHTLFDAVVDREDNPTIFATFADYQAYPEYLITFKRATTPWKI